MLSALVIATALQVTPAQLQRIRWVPNPRTQSGTWVADPSRHLQPATIDSRNAIIGALERETGVESALVVVDSTSGLECKRRTVEVKTSTLRHATEFSEGLRHVVETCKQCSYKKEYDHTIPRVTRSSAGRSGGGGGGGSFGGGTARGGGAGGRY